MADYQDHKFDGWLEAQLAREFDALRGNPVSAHPRYRQVQADGVLERKLSGARAAFAALAAAGLIAGGATAAAAAA